MNLIFFSYILIISLLSTNFGYCQSRYYFDFDLVYIDNSSLIFADTIQKKLYKIKSDQEFYSNIFYHKKKGKLSVASKEIKRISLEAMNRGLKENGFEFKDNLGNLFTIQQFEDHFYSIKHDKNELEINPVCMSFFYVNDVPYINASNDICYISTNKGIIGLFEDGQSIIVKKNKIELKKYGKEGPSKIDVSCSLISETYSKISLSDNNISLYNTFKNQWQSIKLNQSIEGYTFKNSEEGTTSYIFDDKIALSNIDLLGGKYYAKADFNINAFNQTIYKHITKNNLVKLISYQENGEIKFRINYSEFLIPIRNKNNQSIYSGYNIVAGSFNGSPALFEDSDILTPLENTNAIKMCIRQKVYTNYNSPIAIKTSEGYQLFDRSRHFQLIEGSYDTIQSIEHYYWCRKGNTDFIYNSLFEKLDILDGYTVGLYYSCPQLVKADSDEIKYITYENLIQASSEPFTQTIDCGNVPSHFYNKFKQKEAGLFQYQGNRINHTLEFGENLFDKKEASFFEFNFESDSIKELIDLCQILDDYKNPFTHYAKQPYLKGPTFVFYKGEKSGLAYISYIYKEFKSIREISIQYSLEFIAKYYYISPKHPVLYEYNGLYGYVGLNKQPFATELGHFTDAFARYTLPSGKKGWMDRTGRRIE